MDLGLVGRVALVCGSTKGLGRAVAKALAQEGARVALNGRHQDAVDQAARQLAAETGQNVAPFVADVGIEAQAAGLVTRVHHELGRLDVGTPVHSPTIGRTRKDQSKGGLRS